MKTTKKRGHSWAAPPSKRTATYVSRFATLPDEVILNILLRIDEDSLQAIRAVDKCVRIVSNEQFIYFMPTLMARVYDRFCGNDARLILESIRNCHHANSNDSVQWQRIHKDAYTIMRELRNNSESLTQLYFGNVRTCCQKWNIHGPHIDISRAALPRNQDFNLPSNISFVVLLALYGCSDTLESILTSLLQKFEPAVKSDTWLHPKKWIEELLKFMPLPTFERMAKVYSHDYRVLSKQAVSILLKRGPAFVKTAFLFQCLPSNCDKITFPGFRGDAQNWKDTLLFMNMRSLYTDPMKWCPFDQLFSKGKTEAVEWVCATFEFNLLRYVTTKLPNAFGATTRYFDKFTLVAKQTT